MATEPKSAGAPPESKSGIRFIGRYALLGRLASGGMATVHVGRLLGPVGFTRMVAIKRLHPEYARDPAFVSMFLDEARLAAQISHPNVVATLDVVATGGELFLVMDYIHGQSLSWLIKNGLKTNERIPPRIVGSIISGCLQGLHAAHEARDERGVPLNIVHRDVSPQNVMIGADGLARVLDFGVAKAVGRIQNTREGHIKGKLAYMPPEQIQTDTVSRQADVYAAAVVLWEALTGTRLFKGETEAGTLGKILSGTVAPPSSIASEVPPALDRVVMKGLDRDPARRYATAREMALELERALGTASIAEVSDWLERVARKELDDRSARIAAIEMSAGLTQSDGMAHLAQALSAATPPEDETMNDSSGARRPPVADTLPTPIAPPGAAHDPTQVRSSALSWQHPQASLGGDVHSGESASQLSSVSLALAQSQMMPPSSRRNTATRALGALLAASVLGAALWLALGGRSVPETVAPATASQPAATLAPPPPTKADPAPIVREAEPAATATGAASEPSSEVTPASSAATETKAPRPASKKPSRRPPKTDRPASPFDNLGGRE